MRARMILAVAIALTCGCQALVPTTPADRPVRPTSRKPAATPPATPAPDPTRALAASELVQKVTLIGKVKLISDKGLGVVSNNGGGLISDKGLGYAVLAAPEENLLADATIEVLDAQGQVLMGPDRKAIAVVSDEEGGYRLAASLPKENLVLRVKLYTGGELYAMLPLAGEAAEAALSLDLDTASSLSAAYVLDQYVKGSRQVYDRLPAAEATALEAEMEAARTGWTEKAPTYGRAEQVAATETLRGQAAALDTKLEEIKEILLIGQKDLGNGRPATQVPLTTPVAVVVDPAGGFYIAESVAGRIRKVAADGTIRTLTLDSSIVLPRDMQADGEGGLMIADRARNQLLRISATGQVSAFAGSAEAKVGPYNVPAREAGLSHASGLHRRPDGSWIVVRDFPYIWQVMPDGIFKNVGAFPPRSRFVATATAPDGALVALEADQGRLVRVEAGGALSPLYADLGLDDYSRLLYKPDGTLLVSEAARHRIVAFAPDGTRSVVAGTGVAGYAGDGGAATAAQLTGPAGMALAADGTLYVADYGNALVRAIAPDGTISTVAGTQGLGQQGDVKGLAVNGPGGLTLDPQGRVLLAESGTALVKRLENDALTVIAGTSSGYAGDGGPATAAQFDPPVGLGYGAGTLFVLSNEPGRLRAIAPDGLVRTLIVGAEGSTDPFGASRRIPASEARLLQPAALAIGPDGWPVWTDVRAHVVLKMASETEVELVAGKWREKGDAGDGGPASEALFDAPSGLAYDADGNLFVVASAGLVVRKIAPDGTISTVAGIRPAQALTKLLGGYKPGSEEGALATTALLLGPTSIAFDAAGNMYIGEAGTEKADALISLDSPIPIPAELIPKIKPRIRKITPDGKITTVVGPGSQLLTGENGDEALGMPTGLLIDGAGRMIIADGFSNQVRIIPAGAY